GPRGKGRSVRLGDRSERDAAGAVVDVEHNSATENQRTTGSRSIAVAALIQHIDVAIGIEVAKNEMSCKGLPLKRIGNGAEAGSVILIDQRRQRRAAAAGLSVDDVDFAVAIEIDGMDVGGDELRERDASQRAA